MSEENPWKINGTNEYYDNPWVNVSEHQVTNPIGKPGIYSVIHFKNLAIGVLPLDEHYNTWIVGQFRLPVKEYSWEVPEGGGPHGIEPLESAKRELSEECGISAARWMKIAECHLSNSGTDEKGILFAAKELSFHQSEPEETEVLQVKKIPFHDLYQKVMRDEIKDALTIITVLKAKLLIDQGIL
ncbi:MAG: NUDIX hydrolase [Chitinophagales bacterium]|nr:NUDIX hydrolase [Chitinophagales bacterium]